MSFFRIIKDILAPKRCHSCKKEGSFLCSDCRQNLKLSTKKCFKCSKKSESYETCQECRRDFFLDNVVSLYKYKQPIISHIIRKGKYQDRKDVFEDFGQIMSTMVLEFVHNEKIDVNKIVIESSPMHPWKKLTRGYNQADIISDSVAFHTKITKKNLIKKVKTTKSQTKFDKAGREKNLNQVFEIISKSDINGKIIFIFDDVVTTGSTLNEIAKLLKQAGAEKVVGFTFAS